jgi:hypothetical protein
VTICLGAIAVLALAYWASKIRLPNPATADRQGLVRWLVLGNLHEETPAVRTALLHRFEEEAEQGFDPAGIAGELDPRYHDRLWANALVLIETWYSARVDGYLAVPDSERTAYLDKTIVEIGQWKDLATLRPGHDTTTTSTDTAMLQIFTRQVTVWKDSASRQRRREIAQFDAALRGRWLFHALGLVPKSGDA